jgi:predicted TIM-barrel fold metal-dependent hydrolase
MKYLKRALARGADAMIRFLHICGCGVLLLTAAQAQDLAPSGDSLPIIDAHSQIAAYHDLDKVIRLLKKGKVSRVILSWRFPWASSSRLDPDPVLELASKYPDLIVPAIGTKGLEYMNAPSDWVARIRDFAAIEQFKAIAELHIYHEEKGKKHGGGDAPRVFVLPSDIKILNAMGVAKERGWPLVLHIESANLNGEQRRRVFAELKDLFWKNPDQPFVLIHMALLEPNDAEALIRDHPNVYFITSRANPLTGKNYNFIDMFEGGTGPTLDERWRRLIVAYPDRFVLGFDNVAKNDWSDRYLQQISLWRNALVRLPRDVAEAVAHGNAERLWHLAPVR